MWYGKNDDEDSAPVKKKPEEKSRTQRYLNSNNDSEDDWVDDEEKSRTQRHLNSNED